MSAESGNIRIVIRNRKAHYDYLIDSTIEAGIELRGTEVKSVRAGKVQMSDAYATVESGEVLLKNLHISPYEAAGLASHEPTRTRRLLLHKQEIRRLFAKTQQQGMTLVPLAIYFRGKHAKIELALATGRKKYDKRQALAKKDADQQIRQAKRKDSGR